MALSRREFIKGCLALTGTAALGGLGLNWVRNLFGESAPAYRPGYLDLEYSGELARREQALWKLFENCSLCPRMCGVNRVEGNMGVCSSDNTFRVASHGPHFGEETPFVGRRGFRFSGGSGTIFFSNCSLLCIFCQNWQINHRGDGRVTSHAELARMMLSLQRRGCHNINLVTPTHLVPHLVTALRLAIAEGLNLPLLYNTGGYDSLEVIKLLDGVVDIYLPDFKFQDAELAARFAKGAPDYPRHAAAAIKEMHRQVGVLQQAPNGIAYRGLLIRHLVLPENVAGTDDFVRWVVSELDPETHVNIMSQYAPQFRARSYPDKYQPLHRRPTSGEFAQAMRWAHEAGLRNFH